MPRARRGGEARLARSRSGLQLARSVSVAAFAGLCFLAVGAQLLRLATAGGGGGGGVEIAMQTPIATSFARPDIVDRNGRLLATDVELQSLYVDPMLVVDRDELVEKLARVLPDLDAADLRTALADRTRRFHWIRRGLSPAVAQKVHDLGFPGLSFRPELRRAYPAGKLAGHLLGGVNVDNAGVAGIERYLDEAGLVDAVHGAVPSDRRPIALSLDMGVQHAVEQELAGAMRRYSAPAAAAVVLDATTGEIVAAASLPGADPARPEQMLDDQRRDRLAGSTYELGSVLKAFTVAMALEGGRVGLDTFFDVTAPLSVGRFEIKDHHGAGRPLSTSDIFLKSSNVGSALMALEAGPERQRAFLADLGLTGRVRLESGPIAMPQVPPRWEQAQTVTIAYGHGIAVAPLQLAASAAALVNGGFRVEPTVLRRTMPVPERRRVISQATSAAIVGLMRANVAQDGGTGRRADAAGYRVGGKTGTAEIARGGRYDKNAVIASFLGTFPADAPRYVTFVVIFEPERTAASGGEITAGRTAAPVTARIVERIAPLLGVAPDGTSRAATGRIGVDG